MTKTNNILSKLVKQNSSAGSLDPLGMFIQFHAHNKNNCRTPADVFKLLADVPRDIIAHELLHFFQLTSTAYGIRLHTLLFEFITIKMDLIGNLVTHQNGEIRIPMFDHMPDLRDCDENLSSAIHAFYMANFKLLQHQGGWHFDNINLKNGRRLIGPIRVIDHNVFPLTKVPLIAYDIKRFKGIKGTFSRKNTVILGGIHILEGASMAASMIQRRLLGNTSFAAFHPSDINKNTISNKDAESIFNPYMLSNSIYSLMINLNKGSYSDASLEEFMALSDLALMGDNVVFNFKNYKKNILNGDKETINLLESIDYNPGVAYMNLLGAFDKNWKKLPRLCGNFSQKDVSEFQNIMSDLIEAPSLKQKIEHCEFYVNAAFTGYKKNRIFGEFYLDRMQKLFLHSLCFRKDVLENGALIIDLLTDEEYLHKFFLSFVPSFLVGTKVWSRSPGNIDPDEGIGIDLMKMRQFFHVIDNFLFGDTACSAHLTNPRMCEISALEICSGLSRYNEKTRTDGKICMRQRAYHDLINYFNIKKIKWGID